MEGRAGIGSLLGARHRDRYTFLSLSLSLIHAERGLRSPRTAECIKLVNAFEKEKLEKAKANVARAKGQAAADAEEKPAPKYETTPARQALSLVRVSGTHCMDQHRKKKVKKEKEDLDKKSKKGKEAELERLLEEQIKFISKQNMTSLHLLSEASLKNKSEEFIAEYYKNIKV
jgi:hypothetical protein